jgi:hypothetical protein
MLVYKKLMNDKKADSLESSQLDEEMWGYVGERFRGSAHKKHPCEKQRCSLRERRDQD